MFLVLCPLFSSTVQLHTPSSVLAKKTCIFDGLDEWMTTPIGLAWSMVWFGISRHSCLASYLCHLFWIFGFLEWIVIIVKSLVFHASFLIQ